MVLTERDEMIDRCIMSDYYYCCDAKFGKTSADVKMLDQTVDLMKKNVWNPPCSGRGSSFAMKMQTTQRLFLCQERVLLNMYAPYSSNR